MDTRWKAVGAAGIAALTAATAFTFGQTTSAPPTQSVPAIHVSGPGDAGGSNAGKSHIGSGLVAELDTPAAPMQQSAESPQANPVAQQIAVAEGFAQAYLGFDYRTTSEERSEALAPFVSPQLLAELTRPLPAPLADRLLDDEQVVTVEVLGVLPVEDNPNRLHVVGQTTTTTTGGTETAVRGVDLELVPAGGGWLIGGVS
jgi:hypothetical protein